MNPGDLIVGDADGVVVVPRETAAEIVKGAQAKVDSEDQRMKAIGRGELAQAWVAESSEIGRRAREGRKALAQDRGDPLAVRLEDHAFFADDRR